METSPAKTGLDACCGPHGACTVSSAPSAHTIVIWAKNTFEGAILTVSARQRKPSAAKSCCRPWMGAMGACSASCAPASRLCAVPHGHARPKAMLHPIEGVVGKGSPSQWGSSDDKSCFCGWHRPNGSRCASCMPATPPFACAAWPWRRHCHTGRAEGEMCERLTSQWSSSARKIWQEAWRGLIDASQASCVPAAHCHSSLRL